MIEDVEETAVELVRNGVKDVNFRWDIEACDDVDACEVGWNLCNAAKDGLDGYRALGAIAVGKNDGMGCGSAGACRLDNGLDGATNVCASIGHWPQEGDFDDWDGIV